jgi:hypothetical protein
MRRRLLGILTVCALVVAPGAASARDDGDDAPGSGSLAAQLLFAADESLGDDAPVAVLRASDRGYELLQIVEGMFEGLLSPDGTITDDEGVPVEPFLPPSNLIEGDGAPGDAVTSGFAPTDESQVTPAELERQIAKTTDRIDRQVDLEARADRADASSPDLLTMLAVLALSAKGYSIEQIILDGFADGGIRLGGAGFVPVIVDNKGKPVRPDGVEQSPDSEEQAGAIDQLASDIVDMVGGVDPRTAATEPIKKEFTVKLEITVGIGDDAPFEITARGELGDPKSKSDMFEGWVLGTASGHVDGDGTCSIGDFVDESVPWVVTGPVDLGLAGRVDGDTVSLKAGVVNAILDVSVADDDTICGDLITDTADAAVRAVTVGPFDLRLRKGATATATGTVINAQYEATITLS